MSDQKMEIYQKLRQHFDKMPVGFPKTESGIELKVLQHLFTPEEAELATKLNFIAEPLEKIYRKVKKTGISIDNLEKSLDTMYEKGLLNFGTNREGDKLIKYYANAPLVIGMFEYQLKRLTPEFIKDVKQYFEESFFKDEYNKPGIPQLRVIPVEQSIDNEMGISTYDNLRTLIENSSKIAVAECICRKSKDIIGDPCKKTDLRESCFSFNRAADAYIDRGFGKEITKERAFQILKKVEEAGLVIQPGNSQRPMCICTCCGCCCEVLTNQKQFDEPARLFATNFYAEVDEDACIGCEICLDRCNMDAITVENAIAHINRSKCIGCGVCVSTCTSEAIKLYKKEEEIIPPLNTAATYMTIMDKKAELASAEKNQC